MISRQEFEKVFWERHSNPKSGWSRVLVLPALLSAVYHRNWRVAALIIGFAVLNPILFSPPDDDEAWMTHVVLAERWWTSETDRSVLSVSYPNVLNLINIVTTVYAFVAAYQKRPLRTILAGLASMVLKFWYVGELVRRYENKHTDPS